MQNKGDGNDDEHEFVLHHVFEDAHIVQFPTVEGVEKLEEGEECKEYGQHFPLPCP